MKPSLLSAVAILLVFSGMMTSCRKDDKVTLPAKLYITGCYRTSEVRLFTNKTEITDAAVINRFIKDVKVFNMSDTTGTSNSDYISFESEDTAVFSWTSMKFSVVRNSDRFLFYSKDYYNDFDPFNRMMVLSDTIKKYRAPRLQVPQGTNLSHYLAKETRTARGDYSELDVSVVAYKITSFGAGSWCIFYNEFSEAAVQAFGQQDTLAVQTYVYRFAKK